MIKGVPLSGTSRKAGLLLSQKSVRQDRRGPAGKRVRDRLPRWAYPWTRGRDLPANPRLRVGKEQRQPPTRLQVLYCMGSDCPKQKSHIQRKGQHLPRPTHVVIAQLYCAVNMVFFRVVQLFQATFLGKQTFEKTGAVSWVLPMYFCPACLMASVLRLPAVRQLQINGIRPFIRSEMAPFIGSKRATIGSDKLTRLTRSAIM